MQLSNGHFDLRDCAITPGEYNIQRSFSSQKRNDFNKNTFTFFELSKILKYKKAIFISKLNYWLNKCGRNIEIGEAKWIYNTMKDWTKQFNWSLSTLKRIVYSLEKEGIIISKKINAKKWNHTKWYTIDYNKLYLLLGASKNGAYYFKKKRNNRTDQNETIIVNNNSNNYTNNISSNKDLSDKRKNLKQEEKEIINKMVHIWNKVFEYSINPIKAYSNKKNQSTLISIYKTIFNNDLNKWREYVCKINSSQFLMGEKKTKNNFKAVFGWLIKEETIEKIMNDEYGVGDRKLDMNNLDKNIKEKEYEIRVNVRKKVAQYLENKVNKDKEEAEFKEYLMKEKYEEDEDKYKVKKYMNKVSKYEMYGCYITPSHFYYPGKEESREKIFNAYLMNKYLGLDELEIQEKIKEIRKRKERKSIIFEKMNKILEELIKKQRDIEYLELNKRIDKNGLQAIV